MRLCALGAAGTVPHSRSTWATAGALWVLRTLPDCCARYSSSASCCRDASRLCASSRVASSMG